MPDELEPLRVAAKGLLYPSETDAPIEVVSGAGVPAGAKESSVAAFFDELKDSDDAVKFAKLRAAVEATLGDAKVYRVGGPEVQVYVLGKTKSGATGGLKTISVET